jgi:hypothetical protein
VFLDPVDELRELDHGLNAGTRREHNCANASS